MATPTCLACDRPFPPNKGLATMPHGHRVAYDPERGRVWRICTGCGEWNLLSREDAGQILPEVDRVATSLPVEVLDQGLSRSRKDFLEILRVGVSPGAPRDPGMADRHAKVSRRQNRMALAGVVSIAAVLTMPWWFGPDKVIGGGMSLRSIAGLCGMLWSAQLLGRIPRIRRLQLGTGSTQFGLSAVLLAMAILAAADAQELGMFLTSWIMLTPMWMWIETGLPFGRTVLPSGGKAWVRRRELDETRLRIDAAGNICLTLPNGRDLDVQDSAAVLRDLLDGYSWETSAEAQKAAATLLQEVEPLEGVVEILRPALDADPDGLQLVRLPPSWRAALDLALAADRGLPGRLSALASKAREAQQVAAIAETLDTDP